MKRFVLISTACLAMVAVAAMADDLPQISRGGGRDVHHGAPVMAGAKQNDTTYILGWDPSTNTNPTNYVGRFQTGGGPNSGGSPAFFSEQQLDPPIGVPADHWYGVDRTYSDDHFWSVTDNTALVIDGARSLWVGVYQPSTWWNPGAPGYGNGWNQSVVYTYTDAAPAVGTVFQWQAAIHHDSEGADYDYLLAEWFDGVLNAWTELGRFQGPSASAALNASVTITALGQFSGDFNNQIKLRLRFVSDGAWSDEDGLAPTTRGGAQIDNVVVLRNSVVIDSQNFEAVPVSLPGEQMAFGNWQVALDPGVGNFGKLWSNLSDVDECAFNVSPVLAFIDDGTITGEPYLGTTWTYGPGGYIVNPVGGLMGPDFHIFCGAISPIVPVVPGPGKPGIDGMWLRFDVYRHEELGAPAQWPGMFYIWEVRSVNINNPETPNISDIHGAGWQNENFVYYGGPNWLRSTFNITGRMVPGRTHMQVMLSVYELGWAWGWVGTDGTPAPYFDNVAVLGFPFPGPSITAREIDIAQDNFPESGTLDFANLQNNWIKFDMARSISPQAHAYNNPGDSIYFDILVVRDGFTLADDPKLHFKLKMNPLFPIGMRELAHLDGWSESGGVITGWVYGRQTYSNPCTNPLPVANRWNFDLDGYFDCADPTAAPKRVLYPGDVLHYYIEAQDTDGVVVGTTTLPGNITGYGNFSGLFNFSRTFTVRGLPTLNSATAGDQPKILWWNDFDTRGGEDEWLYALSNLGLVQGVHYDAYYTNGPSSNVGNGLGGRALPSQIAGYDVLLYTAGDLTANVLGVGNAATEPGDDVGLLTSWFEFGDKKAFMTGDDLTHSLQATGGTADVFRSTYLSVNYLTRSIRSTINNQMAPLVKAYGSNPVTGFNGLEWIAYGGCFGINAFDGVQTVGSAQKLAYFVNPTCGDTYAYAAAVRNVGPDNAEVIYLPYDFIYIHDAPGHPCATQPLGTVPARTKVLQAVLLHFGQTLGTTPTGVLPDAVLAVSNYPNPFNPATTIKLNLPRTGEVSLKVFNVRGELVRTLVDGQLEAGSHDIVWDGTTDRGSQAASGVYFYETRTGGEIKVNKMALIK